jgi:hypothetical protein
MSVAVGTVAEVAGWNAWRALRERSHLVLRWGSPAGHDGQIDPGGTIWLHPGLSRVDRHATLAHELVHDERGLLPAGTPPAVVQREELQVHAETARRLVPLEELARFVSRADFEPVTARDVAAEFDVPTRVAERAMAQLRHPTGRERKA